MCPKPVNKLALRGKASRAGSRTCKSDPTNAHFGHRSRHRNGVEVLVVMSMDKASIGVVLALTLVSCGRQNEPRANPQRSDAVTPTPFDGLAAVPRTITTCVTVGQKSDECPPAGSTAPGCAIAPGNCVSHPPNNIKACQYSRNTAAGCACFDGEVQTCYVSATGPVGVAICNAAGGSYSWGTCQPLNVGGTSNR
jgi:hypothetical protein